MVFAGYLWKSDYHNTVRGQEGNETRLDDILTKPHKTVMIYLKFFSRKKILFKIVYFNYALINFDMAKRQIIFVYTRGSIMCYTVRLGSSNVHHKTTSQNR